MAGKLALRSDGKDDVHKSAMTAVKSAGKKRKPDAGGKASAGAGDKKQKKQKTRTLEKREEKATDSSSESEIVEEAIGEPEAPSVPAEDPRRLENFRLCPEIRSALQKKGISSLFPIQADTFDIVLGGSDLIARARTGQVRAHTGET